MAQINSIAQLRSLFEHSTELEGGTKPFQEALGKNGNLQESNQVRSVVSSYANTLYNKYEQYVADIKNPLLRENMIVQMHNWSRATAHLDEATKSSAIANFDKFAFPLIRAILPEMATPQLFSMQNMFGPTSTIFYFDYVHGTSQGNVTAGSKLFENHEPQYGDNDIDMEIIGNGDGSTTQFTGNLGFLPVLEGTLTITDGTQVVTDDGSGNLVGDIAGGGNNTIDYATGAFDVTFSAAPNNGDPIEANYTVDSEGNSAGIPEVDLELTSAPVVARSKKLRARYTLESQFSLRDTLGLEAESEAVTALGAEIAYGIDSENVDQVKRIAIDKRSQNATGNEFIFDRNSPSGVSFKDHKESLVDTFIAGSDEILQQSGRAIGNKLVLGSKVSNIVESLVPRFQPAEIRASRGIHYIGTLDGRWDCYKDLRMAKDEWLLLFKGEEFLFAGFVFAPWILAFTTPTTVLDDMQARKAMGSLFGKKVVNSKMYLRGNIVDTA